MTKKRIQIVKNLGSISGNAVLVHPSLNKLNCTFRRKHEVLTFFCHKISIRKSLTLVNAKSLISIHESLLDQKKPWEMITYSHSHSETPEEKRSESILNNTVGTMDPYFDSFLFLPHPCLNSFSKCNGFISKDYFITNKCVLHSFEFCKTTTILSPR